MTDTMRLIAAGFSREEIAQLEQREMLMQRLENAKSLVATPSEYKGEVLLKSLQEALHQVFEKMIYDPPTKRGQ